MATFEAARANGQFFVVSQTPDVCKTPPVATPVPYPIIGFLQDAMSPSANVKLRGCGAMTMLSRVTRVTGNEAGAMGGVVSGINIGFCKPITHSTTVRVNGSEILYHEGTLMEMNCAGPQAPGNTIGKLQFAGPVFQANPKGIVAGGCNPPVKPETPAEEGCFGSSGGCFGGGGPSLGDLAGSVPSPGGIDMLAGLAQMAPQLATMDWSNPAAALGALGGLAGLGGFGQVAQLAGYASQAAGIIQDPKSALGLLGPLGDMVGLPGSQLLKLASTDWRNPGSIMGAATNLAGMTGCFGQSKGGPESDLKVMH